MFLSTQEDAICGALRSPGARRSNSPRPLRMTVSNQCCTVPRRRFRKENKREVLEVRRTCAECVHGVSRHVLPDMASILLFFAVTSSAGLVVHVVMHRFPCSVCWALSSSLSLMLLMSPPNLPGDHFRSFVVFLLLIECVWGPSSSSSLSLMFCCRHHRG